MAGFDFRNIKLPALVDAYREQCGILNGTFSKFLEPNGTYRVVCEIASQDVVAPPPPPVGDGVTRMIAIDDATLDALARIAQAEAGHFGKFGDAQLKGGLTAVVDTVINRVAHARYPDTVADVIEQPAQFSPLDGVGSWTALPPARTAIMQIVREHVAARAAGAASAIRGATHFLNPYESSPGAMASWGGYVKDNAVAVFGDAAAEDVHYHGFAPPPSLPGPYTLSFHGAAARFEGDGQSPGGLQAGAGLREAVVRLCLEEHAYFKDGKAKETEDPQYKRVGDYWKAIGRPFNGKDTGQAWSAAFVSFIMAQAGAGARFPGAAAHSRYFQHFVATSDSSALFDALPQSEAIPEPGDIVHYGRLGAERYDFAAAAVAFAADDGYPSHSDIVVEKKAQSLVTIGGNVGQSVGKKTVAIDAQGRLIDRTEKGKQYPWIGVLKLRG